MNAIMITASSLNGLARIRHGFFTRRGGVSAGVCESLNCGFGAGDDPANVDANRARAMAMLDQPADALVTARQVHGANIVAVDAPWRPADAPEADGLVTRKPGLALGILTADCVPVLLADNARAVIGAAHAGWRGARAGVLEAVVEAMVATGARRRNIVAVLGPCIRQGSYEVDAVFRDRFLADGPGHEGFFAPARTAGKFFFDLPTYCFRRLHALGLREVTALPVDTLRCADRFFSHRRATLLGEPGCGRMLSAIVLGR